MPTPNFAVIIIGEQDDPRYARLANELHDRTQTLGATGERFDVVAYRKLGSVPADTVAAAVVFCQKDMDADVNDAIAKCKRRDIPIFPVVTDLKLFNAVAPKAIAEINGFELAEIDDIGELAGLVLETLGLQRSKRKIFISYARADASKVAEQLRDALTARWYSVFLDTVSIRPGALFQEALLMELVDSDVVVLLNSPSIKMRPYVLKEIAFADQAGVGGVQVVWPGTQPMREGGLFMPARLDEDNWANPEDGTVKSLTPDGVIKVLRTVADLRTAVQKQREDQLLRPIEAYARIRHWEAISYLGRFIELRNGSNRIHLDVALGLPTSLDLEQAFKNAAASGVTGHVVYDPLGITNNQADHIGFLGSRLALKFLDYKAALQWKVIP